MNISIADWKRRGSEAESEDRAKGQSDRGSDVSRSELTRILEYYFAEDLSPLNESEHVAALDAIVDGYLNGE